MDITTGSTPNIGKWEGRKEHDGWRLVIDLDTGEHVEFYGLSWVGLCNRLIEHNLTQYA